MVKQYSRYLISLLFALAGINHFIHPADYVSIMPPWLPAHRVLVFVSGAIEILLAILLAVPVTRRLAAWGLFCLLIAVFPANIQMMLNYKNESHPLFWLTALRLPLQCFLLWWVYQYTAKKDPT